MIRRLSGLALSAGRRTSASPSVVADVEENEGDSQGKNDMEKMQRKTFRRWVNKYLKTRNMQVNHIINDWENGVLLINLLEILSKSEFTKYNKTPKLKLHSLENLNSAIAFMKANQIQLVNVGSDDVYSHNPTIVMGLLWTLILKYSLKAGKVEVMNWCKKRLATSGMEVNNFANDWRDGMCFAALVSSQFPEQLDLSKCSKDDPIGNMEKAFTVAEQYLDVARLLDPKDVVTSPDEKSITAYIGEVYTAIETPKPPKPLSKPDSPSIERISTSSADISWTPTAGAIKTKVLVKDADSGGNDSDVTTWKVFGEYPATDNRCTIDGLSSNKNYRFCVVAVAPRTESEPSDSVTGRTLAQGAPVASNIKPNSYTLAWDPQAGATEYRIETKPADGTTPWSDAKVVQTSGTSVQVEGLSPATSYESRLVVLSGPGKTPGDPSSPCPVKTLMEAPGKPTVSDITDNSFQVKWTPSLKADRYIVQVKSANDPVWDDDAKKIIVNSPATSCEVGHLVPGEAYNVRVIAEADEGGDSSDPSADETVVTTMHQDRCALMTGADIGSGTALISRLLSPSSTSSTSWEQGFSKVFVVTEHPSGALLSLAKREPEKVKIITLKSFSDPESVKGAARELSEATKYINLCVNYANIRSEILSGLLADVRS